MNCFIFHESFTRTVSRYHWNGEEGLNRGGANYRARRHMVYFACCVRQAGRPQRPQLRLRPNRRWCASCATRRETRAIPDGPVARAIWSGYRHAGPASRIGAMSASAGHEQFLSGQVRRLIDGSLREPWTTDLQIALFLHIANDPYPWCRAAAIGVLLWPGGLYDPRGVSSRPSC